MWREKLARARDTLVQWIQAILITILLTITYVVGFGLTWLFWLPRKLFAHTPQAGESCWREARGYELSQEDARRQS